MILGAIVLIGVALLNQAANCRSAEYDSLNGFANSEQAKRLDTDQVRQLLLRANPEDTIGKATVGELLKLDAIEVDNCNMLGLDICKRVATDKDLARFCLNRFNELTKFCAKNLDKVIDAELRMRSSTEPRIKLQNYIAKAKKQMEDKPLDEIRKELGSEKYLAKPFEYNDPGAICVKFLDSLESAKVILKRSGQKFVDLALHNDSLFDLFIFYELCQASKERSPKLFESAKIKVIE